MLNCVFTENKLSSHHSFSAFIRSIGKPNPLIDSAQSESSTELHYFWEPQLKQSISRGRTGGKVRLQGTREIERGILKQTMVCSNSQLCSQLFP